MNAVERIVLSLACSVGVSSCIDIREGPLRSDLSTNTVQRFLVWPTEDRSQYLVVGDVPDLVKRLAHGFSPDAAGTGKSERKIDRIFLVRKDICRIVWVEQVDDNRLRFTWVEVSTNGCFVAKGQHFVTSWSL